MSTHNVCFLVDKKGKLLCRCPFLCGAMGQQILNSMNHYENTPIQIHRKFHLQKLKIIRYKTLDIFHISVQNIDCGYL